MDNLKTSNEPNSLELLINEIKVQSEVIMVNGVMNPTIKITINKYSLDDVICQIIEDYGKEKLIDMITKL